MTNRVGFDLATVVADRLKQLLDFRQETWGNVSSINSMRNPCGSPYRCGRPEWLAQYVRNAPGTPSDLLHRSRSSIVGQ